MFSKKKEKDPQKAAFHLMSQPSSVRSSACKRAEYNDCFLACRPDGAHADLIALICRTVVMRRNLTIWGSSFRWTEGSILQDTSGCSAALRG
jgi:hypothetical protein